MLNRFKQLDRFKQYEKMIARYEEKIVEYEKTVFNGMKEKIAEYEKTIFKGMGGDDNPSAKVVLDDLVDRLGRKGFYTDGNVSRCFILLECKIIITVRGWNIMIYSASKQTTTHVELCDPNCYDKLDALLLDVRPIFPMRLYNRMLHLWRKHIDYF